MISVTTTHHGPTLEINLAAIARNYGKIKARLSNHSRAGAVVKANAYGLGAVAIAPALFDAGCHDYFVATLDEALQLRAVLDTANIYVFHGVRTGQVGDFLAHGLIPILNDLRQMETWNEADAYALHIDTGMNRLGVSAKEAEMIGKKIQDKGAGKLGLVISHLACGGEPEHPHNEEQLIAFKKVLNHFPGIPASFSNSSGVCLGREYHFDLARPGRALYGITRGIHMPSDMENVVALTAPVLQYRTLDSPQPVGYGATAIAPKGTVLATLEFGYADGFLRSLGSIHGYAAGFKLPIMGLISMDMVIVDVTAIPENLRTPELRITFIGKEQPVDAVAEAADTIGYEIFTRLGSRVKRVYTSN